MIDYGIFAAAIVALVGAFAAGSRLAGRSVPRRAPRPRSPPGVVPSHDEGASIVIVEEAARSARAVERAAQSPQDAATLARLRRGDR